MPVKTDKVPVTIQEKVPVKVPVKLFWSKKGQKGPKNARETKKVPVKKMPKKCPITRNVPVKIKKKKFHGDKKVSRGKKNTDLYSL